MIQRAVTSECEEKGPPTPYFLFKGNKIYKAFRDENRQRKEDDKETNQQKQVQKESLFQQLEEQKQASKYSLD